MPSRSTDPDDVRREAIGQALRDERVRLWKDLWDRAQRVEELEAQVAALREKNRRLRLEVRRLRDGAP